MEIVLSFAKAFLVGGLICVVGQLLIGLHQADQRPDPGVFRGGGRGADRRGRL